MRPIESKILPREEVARACETHRAEGRAVGFTSGAFDLLHAGHADFLEQARSRCDVLVVGVNSDESVRGYKGPDRPLVSEDQRARLVAALEAVDYVFLFSERRNARNIEVLRPDIYLKAGDYQRAALTSSEIVEKYGGRVDLIDIRCPTSTTDLIARIRGGADGAAKAARPPEGAGVEAAAAVSLDAPPPKTAPACFLDRDGTINPEIGYLHEADRFTLLPGAAEGMKRFADMGYRLVVVTNQAGIGLGYYTKEDFYKVNRAMFRALKPFGVLIDRIYFCPHAVTDHCDCRKPGTALFERARADLNLDLSHSLMIGDRTSDLEAARRLGMRKILVRTGAAGGDGEFDVEPDFVAESIASAAQWVLATERAAGH